jgi:IS30 family transposase
MSKKRKPLTYEERQIIESELIEKKSFRKIGAMLDREHTDISRELERNAGKLLPYSADRAQLHADKRLLGKKTKILETNLPLKKYVIDSLRNLNSPEQIAGRLRKQTTNPPGQVSHETIYKFVYEGKELYKYLRTSRKKRRKRGKRKSRNTILERISIHQRPEEVIAKSRYGDWESDTVESARSSKSGLSVQYERKSQLCRIHRVPNKKAEATNEAIMKTIDSLPLYLFKTLTLDNGTEGARHTEIRDEFEIETYFCDPYCSWQKGGVENLNKLIRQFFPKRTDFSKVSEEEIYVAQENLNNRPRKGLDYRTPNEVLAEVTGGAINT